ncbi:MAG: helix-turn-helix domain-containing protein [Archaeoglobaceae archaeon]
MVIVNIEQTFEDLGLSMYQSKALISLIQHGEAKASEISELSGVPRAKVYSVLDQLADTGLVDKKPGRPVKYRPKPPEKIVERLKYNIQLDYSERLKKVEEAEGELVEQLKGFRSSSEVSSKELMRVVRVGEPSERETRLMYSEAESEINVASKTFEYYPKVKKELIEASQRGVRVKVLLLGGGLLSEATQRVQEQILRLVGEELDCELRLSKTILPLRGTIVDPSYEYKTGKAIFAVEDPVTPLYLRDAAVTENPSLVAGMKKYFDLIWDYESTGLEWK